MTVAVGLDPRVLVAFLAQFVGGDYGFCDRCGGTCYDRVHDCSGLQCHGTNGTGLTRGVCTSSFVLASECWDLGLYMSQAEAEADSGPDVFWAFHGANFGRTDDGSRPNGASGHIVLAVRVRRPDGTTERFYTVEAMGRRYGIVFGSYEGRGWTGRYRVPGVADRPPAPPKPPEEPVFIPSPHKPIPSTAIAGAYWEPDHPNRVLLEHGASIKGDRPLNANWKPGDPRVWEPVDGGRKGTGIGPRVWLRGNTKGKDPGTPSGTGIVLRQDDSATKIGDWS